jgi:hypothetical protein
MLYNIRPADKPVNIRGAGGIQFQAPDIGYLQDFFDVYAC